MRVTLVVPLYNEARRFDRDAFRRFAAEHPDYRILLVDDGSTDGTLALIRAFADEVDGIGVLALEPNGGKAEAVRRGMLEAASGDPDLFGYWDGDLATPLEAAPLLAAELASDPVLEMAFGARVMLLGRTIDRRPLRHYLGRVFATAASMVLSLPIYDTQCGAKLFRCTPETRALFEKPFVTNWTFDVEILARRIAALGRAATPPVDARIYEYPLSEWHDVGGSKVKPSDFPRAFLELARIRRRYLT